MKTISDKILKVFLASLCCLATGCMRSTGPTQVGVLVKRFSIFGQSGIQPEVFQPGSTYLTWPVISDWYTFDSRVQSLEMMSAVDRGDRRQKDELRFKTVDGNDIGLDVIILYKIIPEKAPWILAHVATDDFALRDKVVRTITRSKTRDFFGELRTEEFYTAEARDMKAERAQAELNKTLNPLGIIVEKVSTKDYRFNPEYQRAIEGKKVADQLAEKFKSEAHATAEEYLKKLEQAKGQVNEMVAKADGEFLRTKIEAEAYFEQQKKRAEAIRYEGEAEAKAILEMNKALAGSGGEVMVKLRLAEALLGKKILLLPQGGSNSIDLKSTNVNDLLKTMGLKKLAE